MLPLVPPAGSARRQRPSLDWVRRDAFPSFDGTMALSDSLRPSRRAWLPSPGDTLRCVCRFAPVGPDTRPRAWGSSFRSPPPESVRREAVRASQVPVQPTVPMPCSSTPAGPKTPGPCGASARPPLCPRRRLPRIYPAFEAQSHGLGTCCLRFARRVTTADAKLASGCRPSSTGRDWLPAGLLRKVSDDVILLSRAFLAQGHRRFTQVNVRTAGNQTVWPNRAFTDKRTRDQSAPCEAQNFPVLVDSLRRAESKRTGSDFSFVSYDVC